MPGKGEGLIKAKTIKPNVKAPTGIRHLDGE